MNSYLTSFRALTALALAASLVACGGGGGGDSGASTPPPVVGGTTPTPVPVPPADVVGSIGTLKKDAGSSTYVAGTMQQGAFDALNALRIAAGAGAVSQSVAMDIAAQAHAKYVESNIRILVDYHTEIASLPDFYADTVAARLRKAGFSPDFTTEVVGGAGFGGASGGADCMRGMLNSVYHGAAVLSQATFVGIGSALDAAGFPSCIVDFATMVSETYTQVAPSATVVAYPYAGQLGVLATFYVASEVPRPPIAMFPNLTAGTPVLVSVRNADFVNYKAAGTLNVVVTKFELKDAGGNLVPAGILANQRLTGSGVALTPDANLAESFAVLVPSSPLANSTTYTATFTATLKTGGAPVTKVWSFTTESANK